MFYDIQYYIEVELIEPMKKFCGQFDRRIYVYTTYMILHITRQYNSVTYRVTYWTLSEVDKIITLSFLFVPYPINVKYQSYV